jgi:hypothetical protein
MIILNIKKLSIKTKLKVITLSIVLSILFLLSLLITIFLPSYSFFTEKDNLINSYFSLNSTKFNNYKDLLVYIKKSEWYDNMNYYIYNNSNYIYKTNNEFDVENYTEYNDIRSKYLNTTKNGYPKYKITTTRDDKTNSFFIHLSFDITIDNKEYTITLEKPISNLNKDTKNIIMFLIICIIPISIFSFGITILSGI